jgi:hypothetical protein
LTTSKRKPAEAGFLLRHIWLLGCALYENSARVNQYWYLSGVGISEVQKALKTQTYLGFGEGEGSVAIITGSVEKQKDKRL